MDTAVHTFRHHGDGRTITVVGTSHYAHREYYGWLREMIASREQRGAAVHCEGLAGGSEQWTTQPACQVAWLRALGIDFTSQHEDLPKQESWANVDWTVDEVDALGALALVPNLDSALRAAQTLTPGQRRVHRLRLRLDLVRSAIKAIETGASPSLVDDARTVHATSAALRAQGDIVMVWGAAHSAGIGTLINGVGFELVGTQWFTALPRRFPTWTAEQDSRADLRERDTVSSQ